MFILCGSRDTTDIWALPWTTHHLTGKVQGRGKHKMNFNDEQNTGIWSVCLLQKWESFKVILSAGWEPELNRERKIAFDWSMWPEATGMLQKQK